jgi:hypothetical protein
MNHKNALLDVRIVLLWAKIGLTRAISGGAQEGYVMTESHILVKVRNDRIDAFKVAARNAFGAASATAEVILTTPPRAEGPMAAGPAVGATWLRVKVDGGDNPWDSAHSLGVAGSSFAADATGVDFAEPDIRQEWLPTPPAHGPGVATATDTCIFTDQDTSGGKAKGPGPGWNYGNAYSAITAAQEHLSSTPDDKLQRVVIAHLDTGYDPNHMTLPRNLDMGRQRNFVDGAFPDDARDRTPSGGEFLRNRGHGTATLALLAGKKIDGTSPGLPNYVGPIGCAPFAQVIPIRIADWVVRFSTSTMVQGFRHAITSKAHVLSMSMGGLSSAALVDAVNLAYDSGVVLVTAAGNNFAGRPSPKSIVFPARYRRVLAACGVMADGRAYAGLHDGAMQGNYGPESKMATALGGFTPNVPWAVIGCDKLVAMDGAGTSSATPQIAGAVACWLALNFDVVMAYPEPWMRVEAVRRALFTSAAKSTPMMNAAETLEKIGQGVLNAAAALHQAPAVAAELRRLPPAEESWDWLNLIFGGGVSAAPTMPNRQIAMLKLELTQMAQRVAAVDAAIGDPDVPREQVSAAARRRYLEAALDAGNPSKLLKTLLETKLARSQSAAPPIPNSPKPTARRKTMQPPPPQRRLRVFALDPSFAQSLDTVAINTATLHVPWEEGLKPGPVGEYLEVVDVDPASNRFYDPVDLNEPTLLAQDGWPPSEGNPQFHQQMVYAVAMTTILHFEQALGRKAIWAPRNGTKPGRDGKIKPYLYEVPRLRIYPHALRTENAYYSPEKVALLFGYFRAASSPDDVTATGSMVYSCLSSDIVAHETTHALLDGLHRRLQEVSNPDVPAFHEAFADIVALFQHFTIPELVRDRIAQARGRLDAASVLGELARQFGEGTQRGGPLRDYLKPERNAPPYAKTLEPHARGAILVHAVYWAFLKIVDYRTADLIRIATGGSGALPQGALHPDLINRLTDEICKTARHVLRMCIRALDYCPSVDITFGEYLRAMITADRDLVPVDRYHYRLAFIESFRKSDLLPRDVRTVSEESLVWSTLAEPKPVWLKDVLGKINLAWDLAHDRSKLAQLNERNRWAVWEGMKRAFAADPDLCRDFGLIKGLPSYDDDGNEKTAEPGAVTAFEVFSVRPARRIAPDGTFRTEVIVTIAQRQKILMVPGDPSAGWFWFRGGATLIIDPRKESEEVRYCIIKNCGSTTRQERQRSTVAGNFVSPLRALYFGDGSGEPFAMLHGA